MNNNYYDRVRGKGVFFLFAAFGDEDTFRFGPPEKRGARQMMFTAPSDFSGNARSWQRMHLYSVPPSSADTRRIRRRCLVLISSRDNRQNKATALSNKINDIGAIGFGSYTHVNVTIIVTVIMTTCYTTSAKNGVILGCWRGIINQAYVA